MNRLLVQSDHADPNEISLLRECRRLLTAWSDLDRQKEQLIRSLYSGREDPDRIVDLLDHQEFVRSDLMHATTELLKRLPESLDSAT